MSMGIARQLEPARFRAWLEAQPRSTCIGVARRMDGCPLTRYLAAQGVDAVVSNDFVHDPVRSWGLPPWAQRFVALVDGLPSLGPGRRRVYPSAALALLDEALAEPAPEPETAA
jgi:hypothetical protein